MNITEIELIQLCKAQNRVAQKQLYNLYITDVLKLCVRYIDLKHEVEDIAQHSFEKVFRKLHLFQYQGTGSLKAWIHRIAINECLMMIRKRNTLDIDNTIDIEALKPHEEPVSIHEETLSRHTTKHIYNCIAQLPVGYRTVLNLYVFDELKHHEIATMLGISSNTSKSQLSRARQLLKELLNKKS